MSLRLRKVIDSTSIFSAHGTSRSFGQSLADRSGKISPSHSGLRSSRKRTSAAEIDPAWRSRIVLMSAALRPDVKPSRQAVHEHLQTGAKHVALTCENH